MNADAESKDASCRVPIANRRGLHARAAAKFVKLAAEYEAEVSVAKDGMTVPGDSIMGLMMLAASPGTEIEIRATGRQAEEAVKALRKLVVGKFDED